MKVRATLDINVSMGGISPDGTGCQGYLPESTRYEDLIRVFGDPQLNSSPDNKIKAEWIGRIYPVRDNDNKSTVASRQPISNGVNGLVFTIYDYKSKLAPERNTDWHIGGKHKFTAELVNLYLKAHNL